MLIRLIISPADQNRSGANQMRQHLSFREHFRRGNASFHPDRRATRDRGLIINERLEEYDGTTAVVRTEHLSTEEVEFLRWRAERWMKLRHMPTAFAHSPLFLLRNAPKMFAHTFRGSTIRSFLGLEDERKAFRRFQTIRRAERAYV